MLSNQRPQVVDEADRWERLVESGFRDLGLEKLVHEGMEVKAKLVRAAMRPHCDPLQLDAVACA